MKDENKEDHETKAASPQLKKDRQGGFIKLWRKIVNNSFWTADRFSRGQAWVDLLILANYEPKTARMRGINVRMRRGQLALSKVSLAKRWGWNERTVSRFLSELESEGMIQTKSGNITTIISICNYNQYQDRTDQSTEQNTEQNLDENAGQKTSKGTEQNQPINKGLFTTFQGKDTEQNLDSNAEHYTDGKTGKSTDSKEVKKESKECASLESSESPLVGQIEKANPGQAGKNRKAGTTEKPKDTGEPKYSEKFLSFWTAYPSREDGRKGSKQEASAAFNCLSDTEQNNAILAARNFSASNPRFGIKDAVRFIVSGTGKNKIHVYKEHVTPERPASQSGAVPAYKRQCA